LAEALVMEGGLLASPGEFYGPDGADHLRVAVVQPMDRLETVARRLAGRTLVPTPAG
jgi:aspartate/methionine/tyrosine aminotransferase